MDDHTVIAVVGPTCTGKTALSISIANAIGGEIVACDSRTVYKFMNIGTAKPTVEERDGVPHFMFDVVEPEAVYSVADYNKQATEVLTDIFSRGKVPIICGGTGFYARALLEGLVIPEVPPQLELRAELTDLADQQGNHILHQRLRELDPVSADKLNANDRFRVIRAIEVTLTAQKPFSQLISKKELPFKVVWIGLTVENREFLRDRILTRFNAQLTLGLLDEIEALYRRYGDCRTLLNSVNYSEFLPYIDGKTNLQSAKDQCLQHNNQLARRQLIWFRANANINWFAVDQLQIRDLTQRSLELLARKVPSLEL